MDNKDNKKKKGEKTRQRIIDTAVKLFSEKGYDRVKIIDILTQSQVSPGAFYNYFSNKEDLFLEIIRLGGESLKEFFQQNHPFKQKFANLEEFVSAMGAGVNYFLDFAERNRQIFSILFNELLYRNPRIKLTTDELIRDFIRIFKKQLEQATAEGLVKNLDKELTSWLFLCMLLGMAQVYLENPHLPKEKISQSLAEVFLFGVLRRS